MAGILDHPGPSGRKHEAIELDKSEEVQVDLRMGAGELRVRGGADNLMEGRFTYNRLRLRPEISYDASWLSRASGGDGA